MNTGAEAVETAIKIARKWGYKVKGIPANEALVLGVAENFHGRTFSAVSLSTDPECRANYGPYIPGVGPISPVTGRPLRFNHAEDLEEALKSHGDKIAAFLVEPIQGEAGIIVPDDGYLKRVRELCTQYNVLLVCDEIQTGKLRSTASSLVVLNKSRYCTNWPPPLLRTLRHQARPCSPRKSHLRWCVPSVRRSS
jgi:ornithine--oxo-acid transaminase